DSAHEYLKELGAETVFGREQFDDRSGQAMLSGRWAGAVDTVGGNILTTILRATRYGGCVAACGLTAGNALSMTVFPFILRGVTLCGIDSGFCAPQLRHPAWDRLAGPWKPDCLERIAQFINLEQLPPKIDQILAAQITGRVVVEIGGEEGENEE
ncbi:MAG: zinc-binding dehydrogenase, partial [Candidatus Nealsonbacteria bacterium]|nr:zinc-binding dehydrogenase [Candidatus Nealsonbacteria bacterium]